MFGLVTTLRAGGSLGSDADCYAGLVGAVAYEARSKAAAVTEIMATLWVVFNMLHPCFCAFLPRFWLKPSEFLMQSHHLADNNQSRWFNDRLRSHPRHCFEGGVQHFLCGLRALLN